MKIVNVVDAIISSDCIYMHVLNKHDSIYSTCTCIFALSTCIRGSIKGSSYFINVFVQLHNILIACFVCSRNNSNRLISIGLGLITVMLECGGNTISRINSLKPLVQDGLSHYLLLVSLGCWL